MNSGLRRYQEARRETQARDAAEREFATRRHLEANREYFAQEERLRQERAERRAKAARAAGHARRLAAEAQRTPAWADLAAIRSVYEQAQALSETTGVPHHVDHVIPLRGRNVSGLHVHWNLRAIPATDNMRKSNRHEV